MTLMIGFPLEDTSLEPILTMCGLKTEDLAWGVVMLH
jgi:hypothetical protein